MASVIKDTGEIWSRLFDHRPFVQGEITFFLREFQEKRTDREVERLFKILEYATELKGNQLDRVERLGECHLPTLKANADVALSMCNRALRRDDDFDVDSGLSDNRLLRRKEWEKFVNDISDECRKVDQTFQRKENEIREFYADLETKLRITALDTEFAESMLESIVDPTIAIKPTTKLIDFILKDVRCTDDDAPIGIVSLRESNRSKRDEIATASLRIEDLQWLNRYLREYRRTTERKIYLHQLVHDSDVILPSPRTIPRNPELEARVQRLTARQSAKEYRAMTKSIDSVRKFLPEDSVAYQMKQINKQLIAVAQFVFSVIAAFVFGFIGVELIIEDLDFGFRLLLGIICALIVALAEIYFLALKLNDDGYDVSATFASEKLHRE